MMSTFVSLCKGIISRFFIFGNIRRPIKLFRINLLYWISDEGRDNVGDLLSKVVWEWLCNRSGVNPNKLCLKTRKVAVIGSVLSFVGGGKTTVYGAGLMTEKSVLCLNNPMKGVKLDVRAVRGPLTARALEDAGLPTSNVYGDPAILMPLIYMPKVRKIPGKVVIIPHHSKIERYKGKYDNVLDTYTSNWKDFIKEIMSADKVISSSLHGIILAEAYGVPCVMLNDYPGEIFKYEDYYYSTGRHVIPICETIEEGICNSGGEINENLSSMQSALLSVFPIDIFS